MLAIKQMEYQSIRGFKKLNMKLLPDFWGRILRKISPLIHKYKVLAEQKINKIKTHFYLVLEIYFLNDYTLIVH